MREILDGSAFRDMLLTAAACLEQRRQEINELNVFPVPDGDTGTNMSLTMTAAANELAAGAPNGLGAAAELAAGAMLRGARGNSGVILSLLMRGFAKSVKGEKSADAAAVAQAMNDGVAAAYKAVMKPAEGTILTVSRLACAEAAAAAADGCDIEQMLERAVKAGGEALADTVNQNPVLKKAGVVDSGGMGYTVILEAALGALRGNVQTAVVSAAQGGDSVFSKFDTEDIKFCYCTEFIVKRETDKAPELMRSYLASIGDSLVMLEDDELIKVHVHSNCPGDVISEALTYGSLVSVKVENMRLQHSDKLARDGGAEPEDDGTDEAAPEKEFGIVAVCAGEGLADTFAQLGADGIISGGQTMNPATEDILKKIIETPAETVFVLPNNKNIIMAAQQCVGMCGKNVTVVPTTSVQQGISAMLAFDASNGAEENLAAMSEAAEAVTSLSVTYAARDSSFDDRDIKAGDYLLLKESKLLGTCRSMAEAAERMAEALAECGAEVIGVFYGSEVTPDAAQAFADSISGALPDAELSLVSGGQPVYYYLISAE